MYKYIMSKHIDKKNKKKENKENKNKENKNKGYIARYVDFWCYPIRDLGFFGLFMMPILLMVPLFLLIGVIMFIDYFLCGGYFTTQDSKPIKSIIIKDSLPQDNKQMEQLYRTLQDSYKLEETNS